MTDLILTKIKLYQLLIEKSNQENLTLDETDLIFILSRDAEIQKILSKK
jgi:hypothetical protein